MGLEVEFNTVLALRNISELESGAREEDECVPLEMVVGDSYSFLKSDQRIYPLMQEMDLLETLGNQKFSSPIAKIKITEVRHFLYGDPGEETVHTRGTYEVVRVIDELSQRAWWNVFK
jgi:hypothetical protein